MQNFSMNIYIANREWLIDTINAAFMRGAISLERDILIPHLDTYKSWLMSIKDMWRESPT